MKFKLLIYVMKVFNSFGKVSSYHEALMPHTRLYPWMNMHSQHLL